MINRLSPVVLFLLPASVLWIAASLFSGAGPAIVPVVLLLPVFCLPGLAVTRFLGLDRPGNPALSLATACITGFFVSTLTGIVILYLLPRTYFIVLICPALLLIAWCVILRLPAKKSPPDQSLDTGEQRDSPATHTPSAEPGTEAGITGTTISRRSDLIAVILIMILALATVLYPLANIGKEYPEGRFYRTYFNVDFLKHVAVTAHLSHAGIPPDNPYLKTDEPLHYYWFFYLFPAAVRALNLPGVETLDILRVLTIWGVLVFCQLLYGLIRCFTRHRTAVITAIICGLFAYSYEGLLVLSKIRERRDPLLYGIGRFNVDAATRWFIGHPQIDGLYRTLIFTPQHLFGLMMFCLSFFVFSEWFSDSRRQSVSRLGFMGLLTGLTFGFSSFIGIIGYIWLTTITAYVFFRRGDIRTTVHVALSLAGSILILLALGILYRRPDSLVFLPQSSVISQLPRFLIFNFGPLILLFPAGLYRGFRTHRFITLNLSGILLLCFFLILFIQIRDFPTDMGIKLGLIASFSFMVFTAIGLSSTALLQRRIMLGLAILLMLPALPTLFMDIFNSGDATNLRYSTFVEQEDIEASLWIRDNLPQDARIQSDPYQRYEAYSLIPTIAERRTVVGDKMHARIFLSDPGVFDTLDTAVNQLYREKDPVRVAEMMRDIGIDYILVGRTERELYPGVHQTFNHFVTPYRRNGVSIHSTVLIASLGDPVVSVVPPAPDGGLDRSVHQVSVPVVSHDPDYSHTYVLEVALHGSEDPATIDPVRSVIQLPPIQSIEHTVSLHVDPAVLGPSPIFRIALYHLPDEQDIFFQTRFSIDDSPLRYRMSQYDFTRINAGVLPPGRYRVSVQFPSRHKDEQVSGNGMLQVQGSTLPDTGLMLTIGPETDAESEPLPFELESASDIVFDLVLTHTLIPASTVLNLEWLSNNQHGQPLAVRTLHYNL